MQKRKAGRKKFNETRHPIYKGVRERKGKYGCVSFDNLITTKIVYGLELFAHPAMAAIAYDVAALAFKGDAASLNFPHEATSLPRLNPQTSSIRDIQFAAMQAAHEKHFPRSEFQHKESAEIYASDELSLDCGLGCMERSSSSEVGLEGGSGSFFWDEEEVFNMPGLINSMAEGLIITPPALERGFNWIGGETFVDLTLWGD